MFYPFDTKYELLQDEELITKIKEGDKNALNYVMEKYKEIVNMKVSKYLELKKKIYFKKE